MDSRSQRMAARLEVPILIAALLTIPALIVEQDHPGEPWQTAGTVTDWWMWTVFALELIAMLAVVPSRRAWLREYPCDSAPTPQGCLTLAGQGGRSGPPMKGRNFMSLMKALRTTGIVACLILGLCAVVASGASAASPIYLCINEKAGGGVKSGGTEGKCPLPTEKAKYTRVALPKGESEQQTLLSILAHAKYVASGVGGKPTIQLSGVNVQIVNGQGTTASTNGEGNLVVGYDENPGNHAQTGSHDLILGEEQTFTSYSGLVAGKRNTISGPFTSVLGGLNNLVNTIYSTISGGSNNSAIGELAVIGGGNENTAGGLSSSVSGGEFNEAVAEGSWIGGGERNTTDGLLSSIFGGNKLTTTKGYEAIP
jgi:hypothetical protein